MSNSHYTRLGFSYLDPIISTSNLAIFNSNKLQGIANYKRKKEQQKVKEFLWLLDCRHKKKH